MNTQAQVHDFRPCKDNGGQTRYLLCCLVNWNILYIAYDMYSSQTAVLWLYCDCSVAQYRLRVVIVFHFSVFLPMLFHTIFFSCFVLGGNGQD